MGAHLSSVVLSLLLVVIGGAGMGVNCNGGQSHEARGYQHFASPQANPIALSPSGAELYVLNTPGSNLDVLSTSTGKLMATVEVGLEPSGLAVKPDGSEVWVANHVSDSVSVVDLAAGSDTRFQVIRTIQTQDSSLTTTFDEPVGVVFASNAKAYVSLSSRNEIAVVDTASYTVTKTFSVRAQEPRAMFVQGGRLYVPAFESGNQSELSACNNAADVDGDQCTFVLGDVDFATMPQLPGTPVDIVIDPNVEDRDLFVYDTTNETELDVVEGVGTLLYGIAVDSGGMVHIAQTDARNAENGRAGTAGEGLADLDNRIFLNQVAQVDCSSLPCAAPAVIDLEVLPPSQPAAGTGLSTPHGIAVSDDDAVIVVTASSSHRVATIDAASGNVLGMVDVGAFPRGVALASDAQGAPETAYIFNALDNSVSVVDVSVPASPVETAVWKFTADHTPDAIRRGRIAFESASGSTSGTFSCGSCHPDGNTDQLLWVIGAQCTFNGCDQEEPRSTMPVRGLRDTLPLHWDGVLGDPFGGSNGEVGSVTQVAANCTDDHSCFRHLVDAALSGVMCDTAGCPTNEIGLPGGLSEQERDDMATFLASVVYPPARSRNADDTISVSAMAGFSDFYENQGGGNPPGPGPGLGPETCADAGGGGCHPGPFTAGTSSAFVNGFDAPTMRGITDRYLQFSAGVTNIQEILVDTPFFSEFPWVPGDGFDEFLVWSTAFGAPGNAVGFRGFYDVGGADIFSMVEEASTGQVGIFARQVTVNAATSSDPNTAALLALMEAGDADGTVNLRATGTRNGSSLLVSFKGNGRYQGGQGVDLDRAGLLAEAAAGTLNLTFTAAHRAGVTAATAQPGITVPSVGNLFTDGRMDLPVLPADNPMTIEAVRIEENASIFIDGALVSGTVTCIGGIFSPVCTTGQILVDLDSPPTTSGMHLLQVRNAAGLISNELPVLVP